MEPEAAALSVCGEYPGTPEIVRIVYDLQELRVKLQLPQLVSELSVIFDAPIGFRVLDEGDLLEFWSRHHAGNGWLYEVNSGGWNDLESNREGYVSKHNEKIREYLLVGQNDCVSVLGIDDPKVQVKSAT